MPIGDIDNQVEIVAVWLERATPDKYIVSSTLLGTKYFLNLIIGSHYICSSVASRNQQEGNRSTQPRRLTLVVLSKHTNFTFPVPRLSNFDLALKVRHDLSLLSMNSLNQT